MQTQLLPIGSVITLKDAEKKLMIIGLFARNEESGDDYDYMGIPYPEGFIDAETLFLFMHKDIGEIHFLGYINAEHQAFRAELTKVLEEKGIIRKADEA